MANATTPVIQINEGNVGIGTTSPNYALDISNDSGSILNLHRPNSSTAAASFLDFSFNTANATEAVYARIRSDIEVNTNSAQGGDLSFHTANTGTVGEVMRLTQEGNVGIGTTNPSTPLQVNGIVQVITNSNPAFYEGTGVRLFGSQSYNFRNSPGNVRANINVEATGVNAGNLTLYNASNVLTTKLNNAGDSYLNGGNVGIGTTSPAASAKLTVMGNQTFGLPGNGANTNGRFISIEGNTDTSGEGSSRIFFSEHNSTTAAMDNYGMSLGYRGGATSIVGASGNTWAGLAQISNGSWGMWGHNNSANGVLIMSGDRAGTQVIIPGKVGVGTTSPGSKLDVSVASGNAWMNLINGSETNFRLTTYNNGTGNGSSAYAFKHGLYFGSTENAAVTFYRGSSSVGGFLTFTTNNGTERMRIDSAGNVGIGDTPTFKLDVNVTSNRARFKAISGDANIELSSIAGHDWLIQSKSDSSLAIYDEDEASERIRIDSAGNVGIGTTSPVSPLTIKSSSVSSGESALTIQANASTNTIVKLGERSGGKARLEMYDSGVAKIAFYTDGNHNYINTGKVAIGTTNPGAKLHIDGDLIITDTPQGQGDFLTVNPVSGKVTSVSSKDVSFGEAYINNYRSRVLDYGGSYFPTGAAGNVAKHKSNNLFNLMSMMLLPGGVFSGKVTAAKPKTGVDFTWTRTTVANYTNEEGVITEAPIATPRIDFANNSNGEILIEPTRTNLVPNSGPGDYGNTPGSSTTVPGPNGVYNSAIVPVPNATADRYQYTIAANTHSNGDVFTYSWYRRRLSTPVQDVFVGDLNVSGLVNCTLTGATTQIESNISGFDRFACQITITLGNTQALVRGYFGALIGVGNSSIAYFGQQLELGDFATTLINTTGSAVTRDNDYMIVNNLSDTIFEGMVGQGGMYMDFDYKREGDSDGLRFYDENNVTPRVYLYQGSTGISDSWSAGSFTLNQTSGNKTGYMFTSTTSAVYCANGANVVTSSPTAAQALDTPLDTLYIDGNQNLLRIRELSMFTQMTSAQLVTLTTL